jgi:Fe-S oxidoreductase
VVLAGHADTEAAMLAAARLFAAAGRSVAVVAPTGCCGGLARALGDPDLADELASGLPALVGDATRVVSLDPHCLPELRAVMPAVDVVDVASALADDIGRLRFRSAQRPIVWHDPCVLARGEGVTDAPRRLLAAAGFTVVEPRQHGLDTSCSGAGLGMPLLDPDAAAATAGRRARQLADTDAPAATGCHRAAALLTEAGTDTHDLVVVLADHLEDD